MFCKECGEKLNKDTKFCQKCGIEVLSDITTQKNEEVANKEDSETISKDNKKSSFFSFFTIDTEELNKQITSYDTLKITESSRGIASLTITGLLAIGIILALFLNVIALGDVLLSLLIYAPLIYFTYKGHMWAIVALALWYTFDKFYSFILVSDQSGASVSTMSAIIFWLIGIVPLFIAFRVEWAYRKNKQLNG